MAESTTTNFHLHSGTNNIIVISSIAATNTIRQPPDTMMSTRQAIFAFIVAVLLNSLQLKYQGNDQSPFETHPKTMFAAITSLFISCFSYEWPSSFVAKLSNAFLGPLSLALLSTILFPESISLLLYSLCFLYSLSQLPRTFHLKTIWIHLRAIIMDRFGHQQPHQQGRQSGRGLVSVHLPWLPEEHALLDQVDVLPPV